MQNNCIYFRDDTWMTLTELNMSYNVVMMYNVVSHYTHH